MKNARNFGLILLGIVVGSVIGIKAATTIQSGQVIYKEGKTVETSLDELYYKLYNLMQSADLLYENPSNTSSYSGTFNIGTDIMNNYNYICLVLYDGRKFLIPINEDGSSSSISINNVSYATKTYTVNPTAGTVTYTSASSDRSSLHIAHYVYGLNIEFD